MTRRDWLIGLSIAATARAATLSQADSRAFDDYVRPIEAGLANGQFWLDGNPSRLAEVRGGSIAIDPCVEPNPQDIGDSFIHDWVASAMITGAKAAQLITILQDFDRHKLYYKPDIIDSLLLGKSGDVYRSSFRFHIKKIINLFLDSEYETRFVTTSPKRGYSTVHSVKISEVHNAGMKDETVLPPGTGNGFLWRMNSYWRWDERQGGLLVELRSISLTRDVPAAVAWAVTGMISTMPRESLQFTLDRTRHAVQSLPGAQPH